MLDVNLNAGVIPNYFARDTVSKAANIMRRFPNTIGRNNPCHGVDRNHLAYPWFQKTFMQPLRTQFSPLMQLIYAMYLDCREPFHLHDDVKPLPDYRGRHYVSFLIPCSVEGRRMDCDLVSTVIFNQTGRDPDTMPDVEPNIQDIWRKRMSHIDPRWASKVNIKLEARWNCGDVIWWDSRLLHVSNNFLDDGITSKQAIVAHTYVL